MKSTPCGFIPASTNCPNGCLTFWLVTSPWTGTIDPTPLRKKEKPSRTASMFTGTVAQKRLLKEPFLRFIPIPKFWSGLSTAAIRTTSNSVSRLISLQSMRPNISRFCKNHLLQNLRSHLDSVIYYTETEPKACYVAAIPCATTMSYTVLMPGVIEPRAVSAHACAAGAVSTTRMKTTIALPGTIHAKAVSAQALASGRPAQTYETVTIKLGGKSL